MPSSMAMPVSLGPSWVATPMIRHQDDGQDQHARVLHEEAAQAEPPLLVG